MRFVSIGEKSDESVEIEHDHVCGKRNKNDNVYQDVQRKQRVAHAPERGAEWQWEKEDADEGQESNIFCVRQSRPVERGL
jgi:hypothetical protein